MKPVLLAAVAVMSAMPALANDTMAELRTGGLVYVQTSEVEMVSEELFISPDRVDVDYVFHNGTDRDIVSYIAFPMPDIVAEPDVNIAISDLEKDNFLGFSVTQDGVPITPELQQRVYATGIDMTDELKAQGVPLLPFSEATAAALEKLPEDVLADWLARGLVYDDAYDAGNGWEHHPAPLWTLKSAYWWKTTFPAGKEVTVHHSYKPSVGGTVAMTFIEDGQPSDYAYETYKTRYCLDDDFMRTAAKLEKAAKDGKGPSYTENWISYVLKTGANWGGSIGNFKLTIDKGKPTNFVSFCGEGVKKTGPTTFEMKAEDFFPERDLDILLLVAGE
ncbi:DUF4424 domain-containing protein [Rhizobium cremeum]|uniref:DUF4424 domain-containing protein n=1 Tax=Rhizobium cremeum TaxID=2813827 RepID=UPI000DD95B12|nr:DUF4424 domain-containing protein [Rhizobium cremeum]MCJ7996235.1 DUF4424 domain-containing protein [Rhizobium cremeum]MCJ8001494.1 DUF4424 domain-containing protein [Rhizobium cremeum]